jgi:hypothetical protein
MTRGAYAGEPAPPEIRAAMDSYGKLAEVIDSGRLQ